MDGYKVKKSVANIFCAKSLAKPGGQIYRTISSLPPHISVEELIEYATTNRFGHRIENDIIRFFARS